MKMKKDESIQLIEHRDENVCRACQKRNQVAFYPDLKENKFVCKYCQAVQVHKPSQKYLKTVSAV
jgi:acetyl-CoA carboxylase beta subunit